MELIETITDKNGRTVAVGLRIVKVELTNNLGSSAINTLRVHYIDGTVSEFNVYNGEKGDSFKYSDFTSTLLEALRGPQGILGPLGPAGPQGNIGPAMTFDSLTEAQKSQLKGETGELGPLGIEGPRGPQGIQGPKGDTGPLGILGVRGEQGERGYQGVLGIQGPQGPLGLKGDSASLVLINGTYYWYIGGVNTNVVAQGPKGDTGATGATGATGLAGTNGKSAYEIALKYGYEGSEETWVNDRITTNQFTTQLNAFIALCEASYIKKGTLGTVNGVNLESGNVTIKPFDDETREALNNKLTNLEAAHTTLQSGINANTSNINLNKAAILAVQSTLGNKLNKPTSGGQVNLILALGSDMNLKWINLVDTLIFKIVEELPGLPADGDDYKLHLVKINDNDSNAYNEYLFNDGSWELIGTATPSVNLDNYLTASAAATLYVAKQAGKDLSSNDFTNALKYKLDTLPAKSELVSAVYPGLKVSFDDVYQPKGAYLTSADLNSYATTGWVNSQLSTIRGSYVLNTTFTTYLSNVESKFNALDSKYLPKGTYLTEHQSLAGKLDKLTAALLAVLNGSWQPAGNYLTQHLDISGKLNKLTEALLANLNADHSKYLTEHQSLSGYATLTWVESLGYLTTHLSLSGYATESWVTGKNYLTEHQSLDNYYTKSEADSEFLKEHQSLANYLTKTEAAETYLTNEYAPFVVVTSLPTAPETANTSKVHLVVNSAGLDGNTFNEYLYVNNKWELLGEFKPNVDLTPYLTTATAEETYSKIIPTVDKGNVSSLTITTEDDNKVYKFTATDYFIINSTGFSWIGNRLCVSGESYLLILLDGIATLNTLN